eukprot:scaffold268046_cov23-Tisochrysis_lutea.AAC.2
MDSEEAEDVTQKVQAALQGLFPNPEQLIAHVEVSVVVNEHATQFQQPESLPYYHGWARLHL